MTKQLGPLQELDRANRIRSRHGSVARGRAGRPAHQRVGPQWWAIQVARGPPAFGSILPLCKRPLVAPESGRHVQHTANRWQREDEVGDGLLRKELSQTRCQAQRGFRGG